MCPPEYWADTRHTMNEPLITLDNLSIGYNDQAVLSGISLSIARASFTAILGANGSGKSTLLKTLLGLLPPVAGRIDTASPGAPLVFGYVPQSIQFDPIYLLTGFDVALMGVYGRVGLRAHRPPANAPSRANACARQALRNLPTNDLPNSPAARNSACSSPAPWPRAPTFWCWTNRLRAWTARRRMRCWSLFRRSARKGRSRSCSSRTILRRCVTTPNRSSGFTRARCCTARRANCFHAERMAEIFEMGID